MALTCVAIEFETSSGPIFVTRGIHPEINAYWRDNNSIVIETGKAWVIIDKGEQVLSFGNTVKIEYVETRLHKLAIKK